MGDGVLESRLNLNNMWFHSFFEWDDWLFILNSRNIFNPPPNGSKQLLNTCSVPMAF